MEQENPIEALRLILASENLAFDVDEERLAEIGHKVIEDYDADKESMSDWLDAMSDAIKLAKMEKDGKKSYPFDGAANIKYPLVATAAMQFNARAYPAIVPADGVVKGKTFGKDPTGQKAALADRMATYMSWQLQSQMEEWDQDTDRLLYQVAIVGDMFRKVWFNGERPESRLVEPGKFIVNNNCKNLAAAPRCSEEIQLYPYEVQEREADGRFKPIIYNDGEEDEQAPREFIEQHTRIDMDGDGYPEPYIVTVALETRKVVRIVPDFAEDDVDFLTEQVPTMTPAGVAMQEMPVGVRNIKRNSYFAHYQFAPGADGKFFGVGLGILLKDISAAVNSTFNMLLDAGHYASLGGGFIGSDFRVKGGALHMRPGEWKKVPASGNDVRASMVPATYPGPDATLFNMLGLLIDAGKEISSVKDIMTGETAHNMQPTTVMALIEQGLTVFTAVYKRIFRSLRREYALIARINAKTLTPEQYSAFHDEQDQSGQPVMFDRRIEFSLRGMDVEPVADPQSVTRMQEMAKAQLLMEMSQQGTVNPAVAAQRILEAASIDNREELAIPEDPMAPLMAQANVEMMMTQLAQSKADVELTLAKVEAERASAMKDMADIETDGARVRIEAYEANIDNLKMRRDALGMVLKEIGNGMDRANGRSNGGVAGSSGNGSGSGGAGGMAGGAEAIGTLGLLAGGAGAGTSTGGIDPR